MPLDSNLNVSPYYDDFDETKNFHRVLFRPGVAVQARELTQLQTILQNQIERFGDNIYRTGTIIQGCSLTPDYRYNYIKILDNQLDGQPTNMALYSNALIVQESSNLRAFSVNYITGLESQDPNLNTLYIKYQNTGTGGEKTFSAAQVVKVFNKNRTIEDLSIVLGGTLYSNSDTVSFSGGGGSGATATLTTDSAGKIVDVSVTSKGTGYTTAPNVAITTSTGSGANIAAVNYIAELTVSSVANAVGTGAAVKTSEGVIYQKGSFIRVDEQEIVLEKYSNQPNNKVVGFMSAESFVNSAIDTSLLDVATGTPNYAAPGANRLKIVPQLITLTKNEAKSNNEFLALLEFENGRVIKDRTYTQFNSVNREITRRTFEESGNYVINPISLDTEDITGNTTHFNVIVGSGTSYVGGERVQILNYVKTPVRKGTDSANAVNQTINTQYGSYVLVNQMLGHFDIKQGTTVNLRSSPGTEVTDNAGNTPIAPGQEIGTAQVRSIVYHSGTIGTPSCVYRLYLFNIKLSPGIPFGRVRALSIGSTAVADCVLVDGQAELKDVENDILVFSTGTFAVKELNAEEFIFRTTTNSTFTTAGDVTISFSGGNTLPYGAGALTTDQKREFIIVPSASFRASSNLAGTVSATSGGANIVGTSTFFTTQYAVGDFIQVGASGPIDRITEIYSDTKLAVANTFGSSYSANGHYPAFVKGVPIDFTRSGRDITVNSTTSITVDVGTAINVASTFAMYHDLENYEPGVKTKTLNNPVYVKLQGSVLGDSPNGPWCLGIPDALSIEAVYVGTGTTYSDTTTNYAEQFELDDGQRDNYYGLSYLRRKPGSTLAALSGSSNLLVKLKAFTHSSGKYFSTESYPIDDNTVPLPTNKIRTETIPVFISPTSGQQFSLRDSIDFRPLVANTAAFSSTVGGATVNPDGTEVIASGEKFYPSPLRSFECSIEAYLSRVDRLVLGRDGNLRVLEGLPGIRPVAPPQESTSMDLGVIRVMPFPSLSSKSAALNKRPDLKNTITPLQTKRYTMQDIRDLENRLQRLEYYTLLNTLEANAATLTIPSASNNTVEVFKNGFFIDSFDNYVISNIHDSEYRALVDTASSRLVPQEEIYSIDLKYNNAESVNVQKTGDLVTLEYTEKELISQPLANKERTLVEGFWSFKGKMSVVPRVDNFFDREVTATAAVEINIADPINALVNAQNEINSRVATATSLVNSVSQVSSAETRQGNWLITNHTENITETYEDEFRTITVPPVQTSVTQINNLLTSVHVNPYMRGQKIGLYIVGLRPGAQHYLFFDGVDLTSDAVPATLSNLNNASINDFTPLYNKGSSPGLFADEKGTLAIVVWMPADTFTTGEKEFLVMDVSTLDSEQSASSKATGKFASFTLSGEATNITIATKSFDLAESSFDTQTFTSTRAVTTSREWTEFERIPEPDPLAQTFLVQKQAGRSDFINITSIDIFFKQKDATRGVTLELREVDDGGYPTSQVLPFSRCYKTSAEVNVSSNASTATKFTFPSPVTLKTGREYAITLTPDNNTPDYRVWTAIAGVPDVTNTNLLANFTWGLGTLFFSTSGRAFTSVQNEDLKFLVRYAEYSPLTGSVKLNNGDMEFLSISGVSGGFIDGEDVAQLANNYTNVTITTNSNSYVINTSTSLTSSINANDYILVLYGTNNIAKTANVKSTGTTVTNSTSTSTSFNTDYAVGDFIRIGSELRLVTAIASATSLTIDAPFNSTITDSQHYSTDEKFDVLKVVSANSSALTVNRPALYTTNSSVVACMQKVVRGTINYYSPGTGKIFLSDSNASNTTFKIFTNTATYFAYLIGDRSDAIAKVTSIDNMQASGFTPLINLLQLPNTTANFSIEIAKQLGGTHSAAYNLGGKNFFEMNDLGLIKSKSNEISGAGSTKSFSATINLESDNGDITPVLDVNPISIVIQKYNINNDSTNENTRYGNALTKYVSKRLELAEGLDSEDIKVYLKAYKPASTDIEVYAKILNSSDSESFDDKDWSKLELVTSSTLYSSSINKSDMREYEYTFRKTPTTVGIAGKVETDGTTTIIGSGTLFTTDFAEDDLIKIVYSNSETDYEIIPIATINSDTDITLASATSASSAGPGYSIEKVTNPREAFKYMFNEGVVRYFDGVKAPHDTYKFMAIKIVLKSSSSHLIPYVDDVRAIAVSV